MVSEDVPCTVDYQWCGEQGELLSLRLDESLVTLAWRRPTKDHDLFDAELMTIATATTAAGEAWLCLVDHNLLAEEAAYAAGMSVIAPVDEQGVPIPRRWNGERAIDWGLTNDGLHKFQTSFGAEKCGDHKMLHVRGCFPHQRAPTWTLKGSSSLAKPEAVRRKQWRSWIAEGFVAPDLEEHRGVEDQWTALCNKAVAAFQHANRRAGELGRPPGRNAGVRGGLPVVVPGSIQYAAKMTTSKVRQLENFPGRVPKYNRRWASGHHDVRLLNKIHSTWPGCVPKESDLKVLPERVQQCLQAERQKRRAQNLSSWRKRMELCGKECTRWLHDRNPVLPPAVSRAQGGQVLVASNTNESLESIRKFWNKIWQRNEQPEFMDESKRRAHRTPPVWENYEGPITAEELFYQARRKPTGAPGPDHWTAEEVGHLPLEFWKSFVVALRRWEAINEFPEGWRHARMVCIPKDAISADMTHVPDDRMRPLHIFSVFYRVLSSCWARRASTRAWLSQNAPDYMFGGILGREAPAAVMALQAAFDVDEAALLTMDFAN